MAFVCCLCDKNFFSLRMVREHIDVVHGLTFKGDYVVLYDE